MVFTNLSHFEKYVITSAILIAGVLATPPSFAGNTGVFGCATGYQKACASSAEGGACSCIKNPTLGAYSSASPAMPTRYTGAATGRNNGAPALPTGRDRIAPAHPASPVQNFAEEVGIDSALMLEQFLQEKPSTEAPTAYSIAKPARQAPYEGSRAQPADIARTPSSETTAREIKGSAK